MRVRKPVIENEIYSRILFSIGINKVYASQLEDVVKKIKSQATVQRQLTYLLEQKYLTIEDHPEKISNIKLFSINWEKILEEFYQFYLPTKKKIGYPPTHLPNDIEKAFFKEDKSFDFNKGAILKNKLLQHLLKYIIKNLDEHKMNNPKDNLSNFKEIFEAVPIIFMTNIIGSKTKERKKLIETLRENTEFKEFFTFLYFCYGTYYKSQQFHSIVYSFEEIFKELDID
ncbi:hypothetical protein J4462_03765 [Candidatus Pacearchaeota archaeon]|nr:hypothetical protein [Candidatus Pacearchaeota archaeon]